MSIVDIIGGGVKGKPHSTKEGRKSAAKRKVKRWHKKAAELHRVANQGMRKLEKKKDYVTDPDATFGGKRIKIKDGPEIKPFKRKQAEIQTKLKSPEEYKAKGGRAGKQFGGRTNLLEELGRVEAEPSNRNRRAEISRVHGELNRGYAKGGRSGYGSGGAVLKGKKVGIQIK